jgi:hypothetical protein
MKRTKSTVLEDADVMCFLDKSQLVSLRFVLAKLSDKDPRQIPLGCAVNCVVVPDKEDEEDDGKFVCVPLACQGGFDLIHNGNNVSSLQIWYRKFHFETKDGESILSSTTLSRYIETAELGILEH